MFQLLNFVCSNTLGNTILKFHKMQRFQIILFFQIRFNKVYSSLQEENFRKEVFLENREKILRYSTEYVQGLRNFASKINPYADLLHHEFNQRFNGFNASIPDGARSAARTFSSTFIPSANVIFPESVDWRQAGAVGPVKNQGTCAGCYAFAAVCITYFISVYSLIICRKLISYGDFSTKTICLLKSHSYFHGLLILELSLR